MTKKRSEDPEQDKWQRFAETQPEESVDSDEAVEETTDEAPEGIGYPSHESLEQELNAAELKLAEYKEAAIRAKADVENIRRRAERDVQNAHKYGSEKLLVDLLPVLDSLVRGLQGIPDGDPSREGMMLTLDILEKTLEKHGVTVINPEPGTPFNPEQHEAMSMQAVPGAKANTVVQVLQNGYELNGRVIRAAMVMVAS